MDLLSETIAATRLQSSILALLDLGGEWSANCGSASGSPCHVVRCGHAWLIEPGHSPQRLDAGDLVLLPRWDQHGLASALDVPDRSITDLLLEAGARAWQPGEMLDAPISIRTEGAPRCEILSMVFRTEAPSGNHLLAGLPRRVILRNAEKAMGGMLEMVVRFIADEADQPRQGYAAVANRLAELLFIQIIRFQMLNSPDAMTGLLRGLSDPALARARPEMHRLPGAAWSVQRIAMTCGLSRSSFAERFHSLVGQPPMQYLTRLRMNLAAEQLAQGEAVKTVASKVGYSTTFAFSEAFKRTFGCTPSRYRSI